MKPVIICLVGPTCSGKTTMAQRLQCDYGIREIRSFTTRPMRAGETNGVHYDFISREQFEDDLGQGNVVQWVNLNGNFYGSTVSQVRDAFGQHKIAVIVVEPTGVTQFRRVVESMGAVVFAVYMDNPLPLLVKRYLERVRTDQKTPADFHARRLLTLIEHEAATWRSAEDYDFVVETCDDDNQGTESRPMFIAERIIEHARQLRFAAYDRPSGYYVADEVPRASA